MTQMPIDNEDALTAFLYTLMRDHVPAGVVEKLTQEGEKAPPPYAFSNAFLAQYATELARRIRFTMPRRYAKRALDVLDLDPGVRLAVSWLREHGFETTDSGDGVTKQASGEWDESQLCDVPHVVIRVAPEALVIEADRLEALLLGIGIRLTGAPGEVSAEASYDPANRVGVIIVEHLSDALLASVGVRWPLHDEDPSYRDLMKGVASERQEELYTFMRKQNAIWDEQNARERRATVPG